MSAYIEAFVRDFRRAIEPCWGSETGGYNPSLFPEGYEVPPSGGQCGATSSVLLDELRDAFPGERFKLAPGAVYLGRTAVLTSHTWVTHHPIMGRAPNVIDITLDQAPRVNDKVIFGNMQQLIAARGLIYVTFNHYDKPVDSTQEDRPSNGLERASILRQRLGNWRQERSI